MTKRREPRCSTPAFGPSLFPIARTDAKAPSRQRQLLPSIGSKAAAAFTGDTVRIAFERPALEWTCRSNRLNPIQVAGKSRPQAAAHKLPTKQTFKPCAHNCRLIRRPGSDNLYVIQYLKGILPVSALLAIIRTFLRPNNCSASYSTMKILTTTQSLKLVALTAALLSWLPVASAQNASTPPPTKNQVQEAMKSQLPAPPDGFKWQLFKNVVFPRPTAWNEGEMTQNIAGIPLTTYAMSPEEFSRTKQFEMGATIELISGPRRIRGIPANKFVLAYLKPLLDTHKKEDVLMFEQKTQGDFEQTFFRYRDAPPGLKPIIVHKFIVANNVTDNLNVFTFESPVESWSDNWTKYGTPIISKLNVLPNIPAE